MCRLRQARLLPQRGECERLGEQHLAELAAVHRDRGPRIERPPQALLRRLVRGAPNTARHLADGPSQSGQSTMTPNNPWRTR